MSRIESRPPISAAIICYNEEENVGRCLDALDWCEQVVVVDSGSTDNTLDIIRSYANTRVYDRPFDQFSKQKNYALDCCEHDWILSLDADEVLTVPLVKEIQNLPFDIEGYRIARRTFLGMQEIKHGTWSPDYQLRLFRKSCARWGGSNPHETVVLNGRVKRLKTRMLHYSYKSREEYIERNRRYVHLMADYLAKQGRKTHPAEPYLHWLGNFFKAYVLRAGFLDGVAGLFLAYHIANGSFLKYRLLGRVTREANQAASSRSETKVSTIQKKRVA